MAPLPSTDTSNVKRTSWQRNGIDTQCLLKWMTTEGKYSKYQGKNNSGEKKKRVTEKLAEEMKNLGCIRSAKSIQNKIEDFVKKFKDTQDWINGTGCGVAKEKGTFDEEVKKMFYLYFDLEPILGTRSGVKPPSTNESAGFLLSLGKYTSSSTAKAAVARNNDDDNNGDDDDNDDDTNGKGAVDTNTVAKIPPSMIQKLGAAKATVPASKSTHRNAKGSILERTMRMELETGTLRKDVEETEKKKRQKLDAEIELCEIDKKVKIEQHEIEMKTKAADEEVKAGERFLALLGQYNELKKQFTNDQIIAMFPSMEKFCK